MKVTWIAAGTLGCAGALVAALGGADLLRPAGPDLSQAVAEPGSHRIAATAGARPARVHTAPRIPAPAGPATPQASGRVAPPQPAPGPAWSRVVASGDTLDALLAESGLAPEDRRAVVAAIADKTDAGGLRPGHRVSVQSLSDGTPAAVSLTIDDGRRVVTMLGDSPASRLIDPETTTRAHAGTVAVDGTIFAALEGADIPTRFAADFTDTLGGIVDFRRDMQGGETLDVLWHEDVSADGTRIGQPGLRYAALALDGAVIELLDGAGGVTVFRNGNLVQTAAMPVEDARLSSPFGPRDHPIRNRVIMHTGVDYAAARGTPVHATAPGRVSFVGRRGGYGRVVEIDHGDGRMSRYAHLSTVAQELSDGGRVGAGDVIGAVGATGLATGPNLHYEVRIAGRPVDPLSDERVAEMTETTDRAAAARRLAAARTETAARLDRRVAAMSRLTLSTKGK
ncbi:Peptidase family M23 [Tranquillimonas rosea]|uniref:Peptidase family M23 n=1 Tax=Tranquillimonas rosea TaxID=641238 RepID=A0A1H9WKC6_9RHOB|nr:M23 family metallopeptidase [Tranquillimonas rosea]SES34281.1 Peptidase family M23 [Tranquillimonas rosea]